MDKLPLCSIVMPVFNGENYVSRMIDSILGQTYKNWELYVVNDGSKDDTEFVLEKYHQKDSRINYITQKNKGCGSARVSGVRLIKGDYVCLVDSDDKLAPDYIEKLVREMSLSDADMVWCDIHCNDDSTNVWKQNFEEDIDSMIRGILLETQWAATWNRIFKADILKSIITNLEGMHQWEDTVLNVSYLLKCQKIKHLPAALYFYNTQNENSMTLTVSKRNVISEYIAAVSRIEHALNDNNKLMCYEYELEHRKLSAVRDYIDNKTVLDYDKFVSTYPQAIKNVWKHPNYPLRLKVSAWLILHRSSILVPFVCKIDSLVRHISKK